MCLVLLAWKSNPAENSITERPDSVKKYISFSSGIQFLCLLCSSFFCVPLVVSFVWLWTFFPLSLQCFQAKLNAIAKRTLLHYWVQFGNDIDTNPWKIYEPDGSSMGFLKALRVCQGFPHGPWDSWEYADCILPENPGFSVIRTKKLWSDTFHSEMQL